MSICSAEILLSPAEMAYKPNDENLEIFIKVIIIICRTNIKECVEFNSAVLRQYWAYWDMIEPNDGHLGFFSDFLKN